MADFTLHEGTAPLLVSLPHDGTALPDALAARITPAGKRVPDTDWHVGQLYAFARELGASVVTPRWSRYVADLNRDPQGHALYPGRSETALVPVTTFAGEQIYATGRRAWCCGTGSRSGAASRCSSTGSCRISTSAPPPVRVAHAGCRTRLPRYCANTPMAGRAATAMSSTAASRAAI